MTDPLTFEASVPEDPSLPGDPFQRLRYHYGMLLGAEDFAVEQREKVLRRRLHDALSHGVGTVWGLKVRLGPTDETGHRTQVIVEPGLAIDALGREIHVAERLCLDVSGLRTLDTFWGSLRAPDGTTTGTVRRVYVVIRYQACQSNPVPAIAAPCDEPGEATAYSRLSDRARVEVQASPPDDPHRLQREYMKFFLAAGVSASPRDVLLDLMLNTTGPGAPELSDYWRKSDDKAPLLLATLDLDVTSGDIAFAVVAAPPAKNPDNTVRALLPSAQLAAEALFGERLGGRSLATSGLPSLPFQVTGWSVASNTEVHVALSGAPHAQTLSAVSLLRLTPTGWKDLTADTDVTASASGLVIKLKNGETLLGGAAKATFQIHVRGEGKSPLVSANGDPLAGIVGDALTRRGRGRDVSIVDTWEATP